MHVLYPVQDAVLRGGKALPLYGRLLEAPHLPTAIVLQVSEQYSHCTAGRLLYSPGLCIEGGRVTQLQARHEVVSRKMS